MAAHDTRDLDARTDGMSDRDATRHLMGFLDASWTEARRITALPRSRNDCLRTYLRRRVAALPG